MKFFKKATAGLLLSLGFLFCMVTVAELVDKDITQEEQRTANDNAIGGIAFGVPFLAGGAWLVWNLRQKHRQEIQQALQSAFYRIITADNGRITVLRFAMETQLNGQAAKKYLDDKAKEFNAVFDTTEQGDISYQFYI